ncbi:MAG: IS66 family transposase [Rhodoferax sp.]|nr:IS66 family transposase [Rhodoferax sp.]
MLTPHSLDEMPVIKTQAPVTVTITEQEYLGLKRDVNWWKSLHHGSLLRIQSIQAQHRKEIDRAILRETAWRDELEAAQSRIRDLQKRMFGGKSERSKSAKQQGFVGAHHAHRGQQLNARGHGRSLQTHLPQRIEVASLDDAHCSKCGLAFGIFPGTEDAEVLEIEVKAYRRKIRRLRYKPMCKCEALPGIITAPPPSRLIARGKFGITVWTTVLLDKFVYGRPSNRLLLDLADHGLRMSAGTLAGGLHTIARLFEPIDIALRAKLCSESHWHADETRWAVFTEIDGKVGHRWYLWVFHSAAVVHYVLDQTRATTVIEGELAGVEDGIISCDRYSAYKCYARRNPGVSLAYCWAHQRRDFFELAIAYPTLLTWAFVWVDAIGELYHFNDLRLQAPPGSAERATAQRALEHAVQQMAARRDAALTDALVPIAAAKVLQSMTVHWVGLTVFVSHPQVPIDNNVAERDMRGPVVGRKNFYGSGSEWSGELAATMYSVFGTLKLWGINVRTWLGVYLQACADNANKAPDDITAFLPWAMDARRLAFMRASVISKVSEVLEGVDSS